MPNFPHMNSDTCFQSHFAILFNLLKACLSLIEPSSFVVTRSSVLLLFSKVKMPCLDSVRKKSIEPRNVRTVSLSEMSSLAYL